jgi:hypothetical protein
MNLEDETVTINVAISVGCFIRSKRTITSNAEGNQATVAGSGAPVRLCWKKSVIFATAGVTFSVLS